MHDDAWFEEESRKFHEKGADSLNNEGVLNLAEAILKEMKEEIGHVMRAYHISPTNEDVIKSVEDMNELLDSGYFYALTMGHGEELRDYFRRKCDISGRSKENATNKSRRRNKSRVNV